MNVESLLKEMVLRNASDLHLRVGGQPAFRINGELYRLQNERIVPEQMEQFILDLMDRNQKAKFDEHHELDFAIGIRNIGRSRCRCARNCAGRNNDENAVTGGIRDPIRCHGCDLGRSGIA